MERHPARVIVAGFVERDGKLLVIRERPAKLPADHEPVIKPARRARRENETLTDAVVREVMEESGYRVRPVELVGVHQVIVTSEERTTIAFLFRCELVEENPRTYRDSGNRRGTLAHPRRNRRARENTDPKQPPRDLKRTFQARGIHSRY